MNEAREMTDTAAMSEVEYLTTRKKLLLLASLVEDLDVERFLKSTESSKETSPVFDTSTGKMRSREQILSIARSALLFKNSLASAPVESDKK